MKYTRFITGMIASLTLSVSMASSNTRQEQQRAMDVYDCQGLERVDKKHPTDIEASAKRFLKKSISQFLVDNPGLNDHKLESLGLTLNQTDKIADKMSRRVYALSSIAGNLNCPVLYIADDISTYLFEEKKCGRKVLETLEGVYGYTVKYLGHNSSCAKDKNHFLVDLYHDMEDL